MQPHSKEKEHVRYLVSIVAGMAASIYSVKSIYRTPQNKS
jgi:hypothetical protein